MKKVLFTAALCFTALVATAQENVVKEAKSAKSDPVKAAQIIEPALSDPTTATDPETWKLAGDFQKAIYDDENMKLYLPGGKADTTKLYNSLSKLFNYYQKAAELSRELVQNGTIKKDKLSGKLAKELEKVRPNLTNAGSDAFNKQEYGKALEYFSLFVDAANNPMFEDSKSVKNDTLIPLIANYAVMAANFSQKPDLVLKYGQIGKTHKDEGYRSLMFMSEVYGKDNALKDSVQWLATIKEGVDRFPKQEYFIGNLMDNYIQKGKIQEGLAQINDILTKNASPYFKYVKGVLQYENKDMEGARQTFDEIISDGKEFVAESYAKMGDTYFFLAQDLVDKNATLNIEDPNYNVNDAKIKELYEKARPYYEKARDLKPDNKQLWGQYLLNIYWKLNKKEYEALEKALQ